MERCNAEIPDYHSVNEDGAEAFAKMAHPKLESMLQAKTKVIWFWWKIFHAIKIMHALW